MGTSTFDKLPESLRFGVKQVNGSGGKSSRSRELKFRDQPLESKRAETVLRYQDRMMVVIQ
jgi:hypothetical protein